MSRCHGLILIAGLVSLNAATNAWGEPNRTNFVFFLVDDLGWKDLGCYGSTFYETPNIDRLSASGMQFTNAYAACPVCSPTRGSIMTGKYPQRLGITTYISPSGGNQPAKWRRGTTLLPAPYRDRLELKEVTLAETLKENGYRTFFAGKWHLGPEGHWPENQGFDVNQGGIDRGGPYGGRKYFSPYGNPRLDDGEPGEHLPDRLARETIRFIEQHREQPFFAYLSFYSVHTPLMSRKDLQQKYANKRKQLKHPGPIWGKEGSRKSRLIQEHAVYGGMVDAVDRAVGKVLNAIDELNLSDNTVIILTSDNGGLSTSEGHPTSNLPLRAGKGWMYEGGIREPLLVRAPGVTKPDSQSDQVVTSPDFFPSILELASLPSQPEVHLDGKSFLPLLKGQERERGPIFWHFPHYGNQGGAPTGAVRDGDWKLIEWYEDGKLELFNLRQDAAEQHNLAAAQPELRDQLHHSLQNWRTQVEAIMPTPRSSN
ncbi:MAG: sulfatase [Pirellulaceae bacterium]|nr:sulfatase [Pirellulaceae bacterium]